MSYQEIGLDYWLLDTSGAFSRRGCTLADGHYSRRKRGSPQFLPPGQRFTLIARDESAVWGWWRPHPNSGIRAMNGLDGWTCVIFRNVGKLLSSLLVLDAERALAQAYECGPSGMLTYVWDSKVRSSNPGWCYQLAGWRKVSRSADNRKTLLWKPFHLAGVQASGVDRPQEWQKRAA